MIALHEDGALPSPGEIFVFGSNLAGIHGAGAARAALKFGAVMGDGVGRRGRSYAIPTKDRDIVTMPIADIAPHVAAFLDHARANPDERFFVTRIGCGLAGYENGDIAPLFRNAPANCSFAREWGFYLVTQD